MKGTVAVPKTRARLEKTGPHLEGQVEKESSDNGAPQVARRPEPAAHMDTVFLHMQLCKSHGMGVEVGAGVLPTGAQQHPFPEGRLGVLTGMLRLALQRVSRRQKSIVTFERKQNIVIPSSRILRT